MENENNELKERLKILGLTYIGARIRAFNNFNRIDQRYIHQRNQAHRAERALRECYANSTILIYWRDQITARYEKWKAKTHNARQLILNLNQRIINLQNNPLNMAAVAGIQDVMLALAPILAQIPQYIGQESPDDYVDKLIQTFTYGNAIGVAAFDSAVQTQILLSKMAGKYVPPNLFNNQAGALINTPALFRGWLNIEYQRQTIGTQQVATQRLIQEKFFPYDTPETYETRIKPFLSEVVDNNAYVLGVLKNYLLTELFNKCQL